MNEGKQKFDCIMVDGYDQHARFGALGSEAFYRDCRARLANKKSKTTTGVARGRKMPRNAREY